MVDTGMDARPPLLPAAASLYLDFDGTLAPLAPTPDSVVVDDELPALLLALSSRLSGAVAVLTGRPLADVDSLIAPARFAGAGLHGTELRYASDRTIGAADPRAAAAIVRGLRDRFDGDPRLIVEDKGAAVALHYRGAPERAEECIAAMRALAAGTAFVVVVGKAAVEARQGGKDKGGALRALAATAPFANRRPAFVGDDVTDEDAFRAAQELGGFGVKVGEGGTVAHYRLETVEQVHRWLRRSLAGLEPGAPR